MGDVGAAVGTRHHIHRRQCDEQDQQHNRDDSRHGDESIRASRFERDRPSIWSKTAPTSTIGRRDAPFTVVGGPSTEIGFPESGHCCSSTHLMRPIKMYRGSRQRLRRIRLRGNGSLELWLLVLWVAFVLLVVVPWMLRQSH